ncbi:MAG: hypothetical protein IPK72_23730 [Candidatus Eisenbacteria bacterium]|nr:hypothetical protein [Candidatus Eisenbacteria bacterium]
MLRATLSTATGDPSLDRHLLTYLRIASAAPKVGPFGLTLNLAPPRESFPDVRAAIAACLKRHQIAPVVFVDDLDRLPDDAALGALRAVHLLKEIPGVRVVLGVDPGALTRTLASASLPADSYLEKLLDYPFHLPLAPPRTLAKILLYSDADSTDGISAIDRVLKERRVPVDEVAEFDREVVSVWEAGLFRLFPTVRHVNRFAARFEHAVLTSYPEVHLVDLFLLTVLESHLSTAWSAVRENQYSFAEPWLQFPRLRERIGERAEKAMAASRETVLADLAGEGFRGHQCAWVLAMLFPSVQREVNDPRIITNPPREGGPALATRRACHPAILERYFLAPDPAHQFSHADLLLLAADLRTQSTNGPQKFADRYAALATDEAKEDLVSRLEWHLDSSWGDLRRIVMDGIALIPPPIDNSEPLPPISPRTRLSDLVVDIIRIDGPGAALAFADAARDLVLLARVVTRLFRRSEREDLDPAAATSLRDAILPRFRREFSQERLSQSFSWHALDLTDLLVAWFDLESKSGSREAAGQRVREFTGNAISSGSNEFAAARERWLHFSAQERSEFPLFATESEVNRTLSTRSGDPDA